MNPVRLIPSNLVAFLAVLTLGPSLCAQQRTDLRSSPVPRAEKSAVSVVSLDHGDAHEVASILQRMIGRTVTIASDRRTNSILINGQRAERARVEGMIVALDRQMPDARVSRSSGYRSEVIKVHNRDVLGVYSVVHGIFYSEKSSRFVSALDQELNAIVVKADVETMEQVMELVKKLDVKLPEKKK